MTKLATLTILALTIVFQGCVYKQNVVQGNPITEDDVAEVSLGMTRSQVQFLLGTPMIADPFHQDRWDYVYFYRSGKTGQEYQRHFEVIFENNIVVQINDNTPESE